MLASHQELESPALHPSFECGKFDGASIDRPLRICFVIDELGTGGTEIQLLRMIDYFDRHQVEPYLCLLNGSKSLSLEPRNCPVIRLGIKSLLSRHAFSQARKFAKQLREWKIDVLQTHFPDSTYFGVPVARMAKVPIVVRTRRDLFYWVTQTHKSWGRRLDRFYNRYWVDAMIVNSHAVRDKAIADERLMLPQVKVIPNGLDLSQFSLLGGQRSYDARVHVGIVAMLRREKRLDIFVQAARFIADLRSEVKFTIAGEGPERPRLKQLISAIGLDKKVTLKGRVGNIPEFLEDLDIGVLCSESEGMPNAVIEYMAAGIPVVATSVGGIPELIDEGRTGLLVPKNDPKALGRAILQLIDHPTERQAMGIQAKAQAHKMFAIESVVEQYQRLYHELATTSRIRSAGVNHSI